MHAVSKEISARPVRLITVATTAGTGSEVTPIAILFSDICGNWRKTHELTSLIGPNGEKVFEAYAQNRTPGGYRIFWHYGPGKDRLTIVAIAPHP